MKAGDLQLWVFAAGCAAKLRVMGLLVPLLEGSIVLLLGAWVVEPVQDFLVDGWTPMLAAAECPARYDVPFVRCGIVMGTHRSCLTAKFVGYSQEHFHASLSINTQCTMVSGH